MIGKRLCAAPQDLRGGAVLPVVENAAQQVRVCRGRKGVRAEEVPGDGLAALAQAV